MLLALLSATTLRANEAPPADTSVQAMIQQAGNATDDETRLNILKNLQKHPKLDKQLKGDVDKLVSEIDRWVHGKRLEYFSHEVLKNLDYDFKIASHSPLYPLTFLYRGRMVIWVMFEYGGFWSSPENRRPLLDKARKFFEQAGKAFPENRIARMYLGELIPARKEYPAVSGAPEWAVLQREGLERLADIIIWWIDNRMQPDGQYGGGWGDDCEMWRWWVPILIGFDNPKITRAQARFSEALLSQKHMKDGYTTHVYDVEHTAEDSSDVMTPMMHLDPNNEIWQKRALRLADLMETLWTGRNERGFLQFKSTYFSVDKVDPVPRRACDTVYHPRAVQPTLLYWQRTGDARLGKLFTAWMDTWVDATARAERGKPAGVIPSAIHWPDGNVGGLGKKWWDPENHTRDPLYVWPSAMSQMTHTLLLTYHMTQDARYLAPLLSMASIRLDYLKQPPKNPPAGSAAWCGAKLKGLSSVAAKYKLLTGRTEFDELLARDSRPYTAFRLRGLTKGLMEALRRNAEALRINFEGYTSEVRYTDRVLRFPALFSKGMIPPVKGIKSIHAPDPMLLYSTATGDPGGAGYFPLNAVRWLTPPRDIAALVTETGRDRFAAELFHFGNETRSMAAELFLLAPGRYSLVIQAGNENNPKELVRSTIEVKGPRARIAFDLPSRKLCKLRVVPAKTARALRLIENRQRRCVIVVPDKATDQNQAAAELLAEFIEKSAGIAPRVVAESKAQPGVPRVHVGMTEFAKKVSLKLAGLDDDGFVLHPADERNLIIAGPTDWGTEFGVCEFLERFVGVRWLLPGEHGTFVPTRSDVAGPSETIRQEPACFSRLFSGLRGKAQLTWARRNRMRGRISFHHNLLRLFPAETYTKTHPGFFPIRKGKRYLPPNNSVHGWQPCLSAPGIVAEAAKNIKAYFKANPNTTSYSLGVTDSAGHCECKACQAKDPGDDNFIGIRDVSDRYFAWCNAVVTEVLKEYPDKWFGCLAYRQVIQPPRRVKVHPRIIPYVTYDRMKWAVTAQRKEGHHITEWWHRVSPTIGWYEYIYGTPYLLPRVYFHQMAANYRYAHEHGVRVHYAEAYPNWGEGPKLYLSLKLQWNPYQELDELLGDWYTACVGPVAAEDLADYYRLWEAFWTGPALETKWFTPRGEYLSFGSPEYLDAVTPQMISRSRTLLESAVAKTKTAAQRARATMLLRAFAYYEASALAYQGGRSTRDKGVTTEADALATLSNASRTILLAGKRLELVASFEKDPVLVHPLPPSRYGSLQDISWRGGGMLWSVYPWLEKSDKVRRRVEQLVQSEVPAVAREARALLGVFSGDKSLVSSNPGFEQGEGATATDWSFWVKYAGKLRRTQETKHGGNWSVAADDFSRGGPYQVIPVTPGRYVGLCYAYIPKGQASTGTVELSIVMRDADGQNLDAAKTLVRPTPGQWGLIAAALDVTAQSRGKKVTHVIFCPIVSGFREGQHVYLDDCRLYRIPE